jgi:hypothetical protein
MATMNQICHTADFVDFAGTGLSAGQFAGQVAAHAAAGGALTALQGGKFGHGFISAGVSKALTPAIGDAIGKEGSAGYVARGTIVSAVVGGTTSVLSGGKFANGAATGAFQFLFNQVASGAQVTDALLQFGVTDHIFADDMEGIAHQLPDAGIGYVAYGKPQKRYTTIDMLKRIEQLGKLWHLGTGGGVLQIGNISLKGGGFMRPHKSHRAGRDIDIRPVSKSWSINPLTFRSRDYDQIGTQNLVYALLVFEPRFIFFNDPMVGGVRGLAGHDDHLHVAF